MIFSKKINQFFAIVTAQSLVKAAEKINVTPSALRHGLNELESQVGKSLLKRSKQGMVLTPAGKMLYDKLYPYYEKIKNIEKQFTEKSGNKIPLNIKLDGFHYPDLKNKILSIKMKNSHYDISLTESIIDDIENELTDTQFDLVISSLDFAYINTHIQSINLCTQKIGLLSHKDLLNKHKNMHLFFEKETLIQRTNTLQNPIFLSILNKLKEHDYRYHTLGLTEMSDVLHFVNEGAGYCFIPENSDFISSITNKNIHYLRSPFPFDIFLHQKVYFKKENNKNLEKIAMQLI